MWFTVRTNPSPSTLSLNTLRPTLRWEPNGLCPQRWLFQPKKTLVFHISFLFHLLTGSQTTAGSQAAAQWPAYQTCSEDHEVSATAEGLPLKKMTYSLAWHLLYVDIKIICHSFDSGNIKMIKILNNKRVNLLKLKHSQLKVVSRRSATLHTTSG